MTPEEQIKQLKQELGTCILALEEARALETYIPALRQSLPWRQFDNMAADTLGRAKPVLQAVYKAQSGQDHS